MNQLVIANSKSVITPEDIQVMKDSLFRDFSDSEIKFCVAVVNQLNLHPLLRQIHFVKRFDEKLGRDVITPQTGIDGLRLLAERTGKYAGSDDPIFEYKQDDQSRKIPAKAIVSVYKMVDGQRCKFTATVRWDEFYPGGKQAFMWNKMPHNQLGKCAEAAALRKAFPAELSSLYADDEMHQADAPNDKAHQLQTAIELAQEPIQAKTPEVLPPEKASNNGVPLCCNNKEMMVSRFDSRVWYCKTCQKKIPRNI